MSALFVGHNALGDRPWYPYIVSSQYGEYWAGDALVAGTMMSEYPSLVDWNGQLWCFHQGTGKNAELWGARDLHHPDSCGDMQVPAVMMSSGPSAVWFGGAMYVFHQGASESRDQEGNRIYANGQLWFVRLDNDRDFSQFTDIQVQGVMMSEGPAAVVFGNALCCFHQGNKHDGSLWWTSSLDGNTWAKDDPVPGTMVWGSPSVAVFNGKLCCFHQGGQASGRQTGQLWCIINDGTGWGSDTPIGGVMMSESPSAVVFNGMLYCFHHGANENGQLWYVRSNDGVNWSSDNSVVTASLSYSPSAAVS